jgi:hypothetical protein
LRLREEDDFEVEEVDVFEDEDAVDEGEDFRGDAFADEAARVIWYCIRLQVAHHVLRF